MHGYSALPVLWSSFNTSSTPLIVADPSDIGLLALTPLLYNSDGLTIT